MKSRVALTETTVASLVVDHFEAIGADVYQEVTVPGGVADIVALVAAELWIIEVKTSLSLALLVQAMERRRHAHRVFVAAPYSRNIREFGAVCEEIGIGLLTVNIEESDPDRGKRWGVVERISSRRWNTKPVALRARLRPEHKTHALAGSVGGAGRWTPFRDTCEQLVRIVRARPGITLRDAVVDIKHHYVTAAGARSSLAHWIGRGKVDGIRLESRNGRLSLYPHTRADDETSSLDPEATRLRSINQTPVARGFAFCWRCGHPGGAEATLEIDHDVPVDYEIGHDYRHVDRASCARNIAADTGCEVR